MNTAPLLASESVSPLVIVAELAAFTTWLLLLWAWLFSSTVPDLVGRATHGVVGPTLLASDIGLAIAAMILFGLGRLRPRDLGLSVRGVAVGLLVTAGIWACAQLALVVAALLSGDPVARSAQLTGENGSEMIGQLFGNALYEEIVMRGFVFVQLVLLARRIASARKAWVTGALVAAAIFAVSHVPHRWINYDIHGAALAQSLAWLAWNGLMLSFVYARTGHLEVAIGFHALWNIPLPLFASPIAAGSMITALQVVAMVAWPYVVSAPASAAGEAPCCPSPDRGRRSSPSGAPSRGDPAPR
jgi:membrane protease YdiL (CAAX protease family)